MTQALAFLRAGVRVAGKGSGPAAATLGKKQVLLLALPEALFQRCTNEWCCKRSDGGVNGNWRKWHKCWHIYMHTQWLVTMSVTAGPTMETLKSCTEGLFV